jgi:hypothetical protein
MRAVSISAVTQEPQEIDIHLEANTVYTFFNSILVDEIVGIKEHIIYTDVEALSKNKKAYFIGEQLIIGDALILGRDSFEDKEATIALRDIKPLVKHELNSFYTKVLTLLSATEINLYKTFQVQADEQKLQLNTEWVLYTFNLADDKTKDYFTVELQKVVDEKGDAEGFMARMASLAIRSGATS